VYQDLALINDLPVFLNMSLKRELTRGKTPFLDKRAMRALARARLSEMAIRIPSIDTDVALLSGGQRQAIAVARAVWPVHGRVVHHCRTRTIWRPSSA
jgi:ABC-type sugar transport system ATPase subunit